MGSRILEGVIILSKLVEHAKKELSLLDNDEQFNHCIIKTIESFSSYGHSGTSAAVGIAVLNDLLQFKNLTPLTDSKDEWNEVGYKVWQSSRNAEAFSDDGGKTYYLLSDRDKVGSKPLPLYNSVKT